MIETRIRPAARLLQVSDLAIDYAVPGGTLRVVEGVSFDVAPGEILGIVGESGSGKSSVLYALMGYAKQGGRVTAGSVLFGGQEIVGLSEPALRRVRGRRIGFVPQNPTTSLSPHLTIGAQMREIVARHDGDSGDVTSRMTDMLRRVGLPQPDQLLRRYPHELSGGQQQRVCIAMALICRPDLVLMDEPTTGLDVTTQAQIVAMLGEIRETLGTAIVYVTHDLGVVSQLADRVGVMYAGRLVETGPTAKVFRAPGHPYTRGLIGSIPSLGRRIDPDEALRGLLRRAELPPGCPFAPRCRFARPDCATTPQTLAIAGPDHAVACQYRDGIPAAAPRPRADRSTGPSGAGTPVLSVRDLSVDPRPAAFRDGRRPIVPGISFDLMRGELLALVGESGSGKTTVAKALSGLFPARGEILLEGDSVPLRLGDRTGTMRREIQYIFQNPDASLNPRHGIRRILARPLRLYFGLGDAATRDGVLRLLDDVRLDASYADRLPRNLSGGEKQRVAIARGLAADPSVLLCDEILSALDVSVQANVIGLIRRLRDEGDLSILFISHDLAVVSEISDRVAVMFHGELMQIGPTAAVFDGPQHPYTAELVAAIPDTETPPPPPAGPVPERLPEAEAMTGCVFRARCRHHMGTICDTRKPALRTLPNGASIRCHLEFGA